MKKFNQLFSILLTLFLNCLFSINAYSTGETCNSAHLVTPTNSNINQNYLVTNSDSSIWFTFVSNSNSLTIVNNQFNTGNYTSAYRFEVFTGSCSALNKIDSVVFDKSDLTFRKISLSNLLLGQNYFVKIIAENTNADLGIAFATLTSNSALCPANKTVAFTVNTLTTSAISSFLTGSSITNYTIHVFDNSTLVIDKNFTFDDCEIIMGTNSTIWVNSGISFQIQNNTIIHACEFMWSGIVLNSANFYMNSNSVIKDATIGLTFQGTSKVEIKDALFNKNAVSIYTPGINTLLSPTSTIYNSIFTCRDIPNFPIQNVTALKAALTSYNTASMLQPLSQLIRPIAGVYIRNYPSNNPILPIGNANLGVTASNIFDNLDYGVNAYKSSISVKNNLFIECPRISSNNPPPYTEKGIGIFTNSNTPFNNFTCEIGGMSSTTTNYEPNQFNNCGLGVLSYNYKNISILNNQISSKNNNTPPLFENGLFGILVVLNNEPNVNIGYNHVSNMLYGIAPICSYWGSLSQLNQINLAVHHNLIECTTATNVVVGAAIYAEMDVLGINSSAGYFENNTINDVYQGILAFGDFYPIIKNNSMKSLNIANQFASVGVYAEYKKKLEISNNTVTLNPVNTNFGISLNSCNDAKVFCNTVNGCDNAFEFIGDCSSTLGDVFYSNTMQNSDIGLFLGFNGKIGQQGNSTHPSDNKWDKSTPFLSHTQSDASSNFIFSPIYTRHFGVIGSNYFPHINTNSSGVAAQALIPIPSNGNYKTCSSIPDDPGDDDPIDVLEEMIEDTSSNPSLLAETIWKNQKFVYDKLNFDSAYTSVSASALVNFNNTAHFQNFAQLSWTEQLIRQNYLSTAKSFNETLLPENLLEENGKVYLNYLALAKLNPTRTWSNNEIAELQNLANQCEYTGGEYVIKARILLHTVLFQFPDYSQACNTTASRMNGNNTSLQEDAKKQFAKSPSKFAITISPNPASNFITIKYTGESTIENFWIENLQGQVIKSVEINNTNSLIPTIDLQNGAYVYKCKVANGVVFSGKLLIVHQ